jgi:hypothetical protein
MLCCPRCSDPLPPAGALACTRCACRYPLVNGIPCLTGDPALWGPLWLSRLSDYASATETRVRQLRFESQLPDLLPRTRERVLRVVDGLHQQRTRILELFQALQTGTGWLPPEIIPSRPDPGDALAVLHCYENVFRDWAWGDEELQAGLAILKALAAPESIGALAVYGAGAGRLAIEAHQALEPALTFALDLNPLPFLIADALVSGRVLELPEFPVDPHSDDGAVVARQLGFPLPVRDGFTFVFADAFRPPFAPGALDAILTPWFVDAVRVDFRETAAAINRALRSGGHWINLGPLRFQTVLSRFYSIQEVHEILLGTGFEILSQVRQDLPYFDSPVSGSRRIETVFGFAARKTREAGSLPISDLVPAWITDPRLPIPPSPTLMTLGRTSVFTAGALSLVDGSRSIADIAQALALSWGLEPGVVENQLRVFFAKLPSD